MYFWRIDHLRDDLRTGNLPAREVLAYATANVGLWTLAMFVPSDGTVFTGREAALMVGSVLILVFGLRAAYRANGGMEGPDFAGRLLAVGWVLGLRLIALWLVLLLLLVILVITADAIGRAIPDAEIENIAWGFALLSGLVYWWRLSFHLRAISRAA